MDFMVAICWDEYTCNLQDGLTLNQYENIPSVIESFVKGLDDRYSLQKWAMSIVGDTSLYSKEFEMLVSIGFQVHDAFERGKYCVTHRSIFEIDNQETMMVGSKTKRRKAPELVMRSLMSGKPLADSRGFCKFPKTILVMTSDKNLLSVIQSLERNGFTVIVAKEDDAPSELVGSGGSLSWNLIREEIGRSD